MSKKETDNKNKKEITCCLCGRNEKLGGQMFEGYSGQYVCADCINHAHDILEDLWYHKALEQERREEFERMQEMFKRCPKPTKLKEMLDEYIIGQDEAKMTIATAVYNHYKRLAQDTDDGVEIEKSNLLICGNSGTGKTLILKTLGKIIDIPVIIVDATKFTQSGYVGEDVESMVSRAYQAANGDIALTERCIIVIDEGDKLGRKGENPSITRDVSGEGVQQGILKITEGTKVLINPQGGRKHPEQAMVEINTQNILFVFMGSFEGIEHRVANRLNTKAVGFKTDANDVEQVDRKNLRKYITHQDVKAFGIIPELIGRFPVLATLDDLDKDALCRILTEPKNAIIKQYQKLFKMDDITLTIDDDVYEIIAEKALACGLGARSLRTIFEAIVKEAMYKLPGSKTKKLRITKEYALEMMAKSNVIKAQELTNKEKKIA